MAIERWNGTTGRYEAVELPLAGVSNIPTTARVYVGGRWREVWKGNRANNIAWVYYTNLNRTIARNTYDSLVVRSGLLGTGASTVTMSWDWTPATSSSHTRTMRVLLNGAVVATWSWTGTNAGWADTQSIELALYPGDNVTLQCYATSATTAARVLRNFSYSILPVKRPLNPRGEARLWTTFDNTVSTGYVNQSGIERPGNSNRLSPDFSRKYFRSVAGYNAVIFPTQVLQGLPQGFTYTFWLRTLSTAAGWRTVLHHAPSVAPFNPESYVVHNMTDTSGGYLMTGLRLGSKVSEFQSAFTYPRNLWLHVAVVWEHTTTTSWTRRLYVNGKLDGVSAVGTGFPTTPSIEGQPIELGSAEWEGDIDDFGYWARPLTALEVQSVHIQKDMADLAIT